ncbi:MAG: type II secretion system GspH family protein [Amphritea sp.]|nr:type II secretion system GspH family protein [Amphritea sp.]
MFNSLMSKRAALMAKFSKVNVNDIQDAELREKAKALKGKQGGFTLLELLVVVAILAAIAGTATIALQDTDARAAAAAHVAMMDEMNKGIRTYRVLQKNQFPTGFDSLRAVDDPSGSPTYGAIDNAGDDAILAIEDIAAHTLTAAEASALGQLGIKSLMYVNRDLAYDKDGTAVAVSGADGFATGAVVECENDNDLRDSIASKGNAMVAGNMFMNTEGNGCGISVPVATGIEVSVWSGSASRILGTGVSGTHAAPVSGTPRLLAVGIGPSASLFDASKLGGMTTVPAYRHVSGEQYNRFIALFKIAEHDGTAFEALDHPQLAGIVDGAGDTKEEELGEWDGTRNTI